MAAQLNYTAILSQVETYSRKASEPLIGNCTKAEYIKSRGDLIRTVTAKTDKVVVVFVPIGEKDYMHGVLVDEQGADLVPPAPYILAHGQFSVCTIEAKVCLIVSYNGVDLGPIIRALTVKDILAGVAPPSFNPCTSVKFGPTCNDMAFTQMELVAYKCNQTELVLLCLCTATPYVSKFLSCVLFACPYVAKEWGAHISVFPYASGITAMNVDVSTLRDIYVKDIERATLITLSCWLFSYAHHSTHKLGPSILSRIQAACAMESVTPPTLDNLKDVLETEEFRKIEHADKATWALGVAVARTKAGKNTDPVWGKYDIKVAPADRWAPDATKVGDKMHPMCIALFDQLAMVYTNFQQSGIQFALLAYDLLESHMPGVSPTYRDQMKNFGKVREEVVNCPYIGLSERIPLELRVQNYPMLALTGIDYYKRTLKDEAKIKDMEKFQTNYITKHLDKATLEQECELMSGLIPDESVQAMATLEATASEAEVLGWIRKYDSVTQDILFAACSRRTIHGAWYTAIETEKVGGYMKGYLKTVREKVSAMFKDYEDAMATKSLTLATIPERTTLANQLVADKNKFKELLSAIEDDVEKATVPKYVGGSKIYKNAIAKVQALQAFLANLKTT